MGYSKEVECKAVLTIVFQAYLDHLLAKDGAVSFVPPLRAFIQRWPQVDKEIHGRMRGACILENGIIEFYSIC